MGCGCSRNSLERDRKLNRKRRLKNKKKKKPLNKMIKATKIENNDFV